MDVSNALLIAYMIINIVLIFCVLKIGAKTKELIESWNKLYESWKELYELKK